MDWFDLRAVQGTLKSLLQHHSSEASILQLEQKLMSATTNTFQLYNTVKQNIAATNPNLQVIMRPKLKSQFLSSTIQSCAPYPLPALQLVYLFISLSGAKSSFSLFFSLKSRLRGFRIGDTCTPIDVCTPIDICTPIYQYITKITTIL